MLPKTFALLLQAMIAVESGGDDRAIGDGGKAWGCLQITQTCLDDYKRITGFSATRNFAFNRGWAKTIAHAYINHYAAPGRRGQEPTLEDCARIWNGGPDGWKKRSTEPYWTKVKVELLKMPGTWSADWSTFKADAPRAP